MTTLVLTAWKENHFHLRKGSILLLFHFVLDETAEPLSGIFCICMRSALACEGRKEGRKAVLVQCIFIACSHRDVSFTSSYSPSLARCAVPCSREASELAFIRRTRKRATANDGKQRPIPLQFAVVVSHLLPQNAAGGGKQGKGKEAS